MANKALLVGINAYHSPINLLRGCENDIRQIRDVLLDRYNFLNDAIRLLCNQEATHARVLAGLDWLVSDTLPGDVLVFHYSGHGSYVDDQDGDEWDCRDEILVPYDHDWNRPLRDDELKQVFDRVPRGVNLTFISDCCHSGTINKPAIIETMPRSVLPPAEIEQHIARLISRRDAVYRAFVEAEYHRMAQEMPQAELSQRFSPWLEHARSIFMRQHYQLVDTQENNILLAACRDDQQSVDAWIDGAWHGAFTYYLGKAIRDADGILTYAQLIARASSAMERFAQVPQLECLESVRDLAIFAPFPAGIPPS